MLSNQVFDFFVQWHLTERCNLRCRHCYQTGVATDEMTLAQIETVLGDISDMLHAWEDAYSIKFSSSFNITGGEPFLRSDIFAILEEIRLKGFDAYLLSNGALIDAERARRLAQLDVKGVQISLEGPEPIHESIRGKGSFPSAIKGVRRLLEAGIVVTLNVTLSTINGDSFKDVVALASSEGVQRLGFSRLVPSGKGKELLDMMLDKNEVKALYEEIFSTQIDGVDLVTGDPVASQMSRQENTVAEDDGGDVAMGGCSAGVSGLTFLPDGTIMPCRRLPIPIGNVLTDSLREVWATSDVLEALRDRNRYSGKCRACTRWSICRGCRAIAYAYSQAHGRGDYLAEDPQCFL